MFLNIMALYDARIRAGNRQICVGWSEECAFFEWFLTLYILHMFAYTVRILVMLWGFGCRQWTEIRGLSWQIALWEGQPYYVSAGPGVYILWVLLHAQTFTRTSSFARKLPHILKLLWRLKMWTFVCKGGEMCLSITKKLCATKLVACKRAFLPSFSKNEKAYC